MRQQFFAARRRCGVVDGAAAPLAPGEQQSLPIVRRQAGAGPQQVVELLPVRFERQQEVGPLEPAGVEQAPQLIVQALRAFLWRNVAQSPQGAGEDLGGGIVQGWQAGFAEVFGVQRGKAFQRCAAHLL